MPNIKHPRPVSGEKYGRWTVLAKAPMRLLKNGARMSQSRCICECGEIRVISDTYLVQGHSTSCGCAKKDKMRTLWRSRNILSPEKSARNYFLRSYKFSAHKRCIPWMLSDSDFDKIIKMPCHYCGSLPSSTSEIGGNPEFLRNGIDRINSLDYYHLGNVVPCCKQCNWAKGALSMEDFIEWLTRAASYISPV